MQEDDMYSSYDAVRMASVDLKKFSYSTMDKTQHYSSTILFNFNTNQNDNFLHQI